MDFATLEYGHQIYDAQYGYEAPAGEGLAGAHPSAQPQEARTSYRHEGAAPANGLPGSAGPASGASSMDRRSPPGAHSGQAQEPSRFAAGRSGNAPLVPSGGGAKNKKGLLGLSNLGNTCFMNAALQCLTHTHGLQKYFRFCSHAYTSKGQGHRQKLLMSFANWFERDWGKHVSAHYHSPEDILRAVQNLNPTFQGYAQQDSQEFLRCALDNLHEELRREVPDDLNGHLLRMFGIEAPGVDASQSGVSSTASGSSSQQGARGGSSSSGGGNARAVPPPTQPSTTRQFMQLCQSTEGVTDVGEIRLPPKPSLQAQPLGGPAQPAGAPAAPSRSRPMPDGEESTAASSSSGAPGNATSTEAKAKGEEKKEDGNSAPSTHFASIISDLFQGRVVSVVRCMDCNKNSRTQEDVYDVSVPIPNANEPGSGQALLGGDIASGSSQQMRGPTWTGMLSGFPGKVKSWFYDKGVEITDCLRKYCAPEYLTGKDKYFCEHCKRKNDCEKRIVFKDLPEVLCIHIKRFRYDASWFNGTKNARVVTFPVQKTLDMAAFMDEPPPGPVEYKLVGLIQHIGSMGGGHYISYCQHKQKPQEWYEFDDLQVSKVSAEQVERAEPYVLFYQRLPSRGMRHDRQTFKSDHRRVQALIRQYLLSHPSVPSAPGGMPAPKLEDNQSVAQSVDGEMRLHGPALRNLYRSPPAELDICFVTKHWYVRLTSMSHPGEIDNFEYLCPHQLLGASSAEMASEPFIPISRSLFQSLMQRYGGGPAIGALEVCPKCQIHLSAYNDRKQAEFDLVSKYDTKDTGDGKGWYLVDALWVNKWKRYVRAEHVTDIRDMCAPGPISNPRLFDKDQPGVPRKNLRLRIDYIGVNARVWWLFMHVHGGGPAICREELDVYSAERSPETELYLGELRGKGTADFARRVSWQFVDECLGDLEAYSQKYSNCQTDVDMVPRDPEGKGAEPRQEKRAPNPDESGSAAEARSGPAEEDHRRSNKHEAEDQRRRAQAQIAEKERQVTALRAKLQKSLARQRELRDMGALDERPDDVDKASSEVSSKDEDVNAQLAREIQKGRQLQAEVVEQLERELLSERKKAEDLTSQGDEEDRVQ
mmetsp:Transcript_93927/g.242689  ORF Transcript_93927/g.242689 Transcript_93927/m.242689 type:complete len:1098 (-) Transcript_93927:450-3743(-)